MCDGKGLSHGDFPFHIVLRSLQKISGIRFLRPPETDAFLLCRGNAFRLASTDILPFVLRNKGENLQYYVSNEFSHKRAGRGTGI